MELVRTGHRRLFLYGWAEYDDMVGGKLRHRTEFCNEVNVADMSKREDGQVTIAASFAQYGPYNRAT